jgi:hypothetical protein
MSPAVSAALGIPAPGVAELDFTGLLGEEAKAAAIGGGNFRFQAPATLTAFEARQVPVTDSAGDLTIRVIVLSGGARA